jgi:hypothetical protein
LRLRSLPRRRPSAAIVISGAALFMSLGGVGVAATGVIGTSQIKNNAVTYSKIAPNSVGKVRLANSGVVNAKIAPGAVSYGDIQPGAVGTVRANINQLQARVKGTCPSGQALATVDNKGAVTCNATLPAEYGTTSNTAALTAAAASISSLTLATGPTYLAFGNTEVDATSAGAMQRVTATCTLTVGSSTVSRTAVLHTSGATGDVSTASIPLQLAGTGGPSTISCAATVPAGGTLPATTAVASINALQTASNN